jgi:hypothetical protein
VRVDDRQLAAMRAWCSTRLRLPSHSRDIEVLDAVSLYYPGGIAGFLDGGDAR